MILIAIYATLYKYSNYGPLWEPETKRGDICKETWWQNLLYINNFTEKNKRVSILISKLIKKHDPFYFLYPFYLYTICGVL